MRRGFTLLELIIVIIIVGILATLGFIQYAAIIEKGRYAEARANLGTLRQLQVAHFEDPRHFVAGAGTYANLAGLGSGLPAAADANYYFSYGCNAADGVCTATRDGTKAAPPAPPLGGCTFTMSPAGVEGGTCP